MVKIIYFPPNEILEQRRGLGLLDKCGRKDFD